MLELLDAVLWVESSKISWNTTTLNVSFSLVIHQRDIMTI